MKMLRAAPRFGGGNYAGDCKFSGRQRADALPKSR
jgi:hypothetical protein